MVQGLPARGPSGMTRWAGAIRLSHIAQRSEPLHHRLRIHTSPPIEVVAEQPAQQRHGRNGREDFQGSIAAAILNPSLRATPSSSPPMTSSSAHQPNAETVDGVIVDSRASIWPPMHERDQRQCTGDAGARPQHAQSLLHPLCRCCVSLPILCGAAR
jgi:hypothetical protein